MKEYIVDGVPVQLTRKNVKNMNLRVHTHDASVVASVPTWVSEEQIEIFLDRKREWIVREHQAALESPKYAAEHASHEEQREWRVIVQASTELLVPKWEPVLGVKAGCLVYRNMRSRWGSCQPETGRICFNTRLALYPPRCTEFVVVHELCHLIVADHGPDFKALLDYCLPDWRTADKILG